MASDWEEKKNISFLHFSSINALIQDGYPHCSSCSHTRYMEMTIENWLFKYGAYLLWFVKRFNQIWTNSYFFKLVHWFHLYYNVQFNFFYHLISTPTTLTWTFLPRSVQYNVKINYTELIKERRCGCVRKTFTWTFSSIFFLWWTKLGSCRKFRQYQLKPIL